jgi:hypothetical protein
MGGRRQCFWDGATFTSVRSPGSNEPVAGDDQSAREVFDEFVSGKRSAGGRSRAI